MTGVDSDAWGRCDSMLAPIPERGCPKLFKKLRPDHPIKTTFSLLSVAANTNDFPIKARSKIFRNFSG